MTYETFEDTPVWQEAARLDRAALSVSNNIAEGFDRGTTNELLHFLYIARGSAGETRSMLRVKLRRIKIEPGAITSRRTQRRVLKGAAPQTSSDTPA